MSTHQWNGPAWSRGAVSITTLYATSPSTRCSRATVSCSAIADRARSRRRSASSKRGRRRRRATRIENGVGRRAAGTTRRPSPSTTTMLLGRVANAAAVKRSSAQRCDARRDEVERDELRVRMLDRRARGLAVVHERLRVHAAVRRDGTRARSRSATNTSVAASARERAEVGVVRGGEDHDFVRAGHAVADDRVLVRHDAHAPARRVGRAGTEARDLGRRLVLVAGAERAGRRRSRASGSA